MGSKPTIYVKLIWRCNKCGDEKSIHEFCVNRSRPSGHSGPCKACHNKKNAGYNIEYRKTGYFRRHHLHKAFKLTEDQYLAKQEKQNNLCAICFRPQVGGKNLAVDHNHKTEQVRDLLCNPCNSAIGLLDEDILRLQAVIDYLKRHAGEN